jgi:hypothetical protein
MRSLTPNIGIGWDGRQKEVGLRAMSEYGGDEDLDFREDGSTHAWLTNRRVNRNQKMRWNKFKWILCIANIMVSKCQMSV